MPEAYTLSFTPPYPAIYGILRLAVELEGEVVLKVTPRIGFSHQGIEKRMEQKRFQEAFLTLAPFNRLTPFVHEHAYVLAVEHLFSIIPPIRAQYIRVIFSELTRIQNHLLNVRMIAMSVGIDSSSALLHKGCEKISQLCESASESSPHETCLCIGGIYQDFPKSLFSNIQDFIDALSPLLPTIETSLTDSRIFKQRTVDIGTITADQAIEWGFSGPMLRGSSVPWDLRKAHPYEVYEYLDFDIPISKTGDCYGRYLVRVEEIRQSLGIIRQCLEQLPGGEVRAEGHFFGSELPDNTIAFHLKEGERAEIYTAIESPKGELGFFLGGKGSQVPYRCKIRSPGFPSLQALDMMTKGYLLSDVVTILSCMDIVVSESDR